MCWVCQQFGKTSNRKMMLTSLNGFRVLNTIIHQMAFLTTENLFLGTTYVWSNKAVILNSPSNTYLWAWRHLNHYLYRSLPCQVHSDDDKTSKESWGIKGKQDGTLQINTCLLSVHIFDWKDEYSPNWISESFYFVCTIFLFILYIYRSDKAKYSCIFTSCYVLF